MLTKIGLEIQKNINYNPAVKKIPYCSQNWKYSVILYRNVSDSLKCYYLMTYIIACFVIDEIVSMRYNGISIKFGFLRKCLKNIFKFSFVQVKKLSISW